MKNKLVQEQVFLFIDNEMSAELCIEFRQRIETCPDCARETRVARRLLTILRERCGRQPAPIALRRRVLAILPHRQEQSRH